MRALRKRKTKETQVLDWLLQSTIPIGWCLRALHLNLNWALRNVFCLHNFIVFLAFFSYARPCVRCMRLNGSRALDRRIAAGIRPSVT